MLPPSDFHGIHRSVDRDHKLVRELLRIRAADGVDVVQRGDFSHRVPHRNAGDMGPGHVNEALPVTDSDRGCPGRRQRRFLP